MIQKDELMIGNFVELLDGKCVEVACIGDSYLTFTKNNETARLKYCMFNPITIEVPTIKELGFIVRENDERSGVLSIRLWGNYDYLVYDIYIKTIQD